MLLVGHAICQNTNKIQRHEYVWLEVSLDSDTDGPLKKMEYDIISRVKDNVYCVQ